MSIRRACSSSGIYIYIYTVNLAYNVPVGTSVLCPLYTKSVLRVYRTVSVIRTYRTLSVIDINSTLSGICIPYNVRYTRKCDTEGRKEMFYLTTHSTHFIYGYMASYIWLRTILIVRKETRCRHIGYSYRLTARVLLYAPSHRQDNTYHGLCYTSRGALAGTRNSSMGPPHEGSIRRPIAP